MNKAFVDTTISNIKKVGIVTKVTPWMVEGMGEKAMNVRYVGLTIDNEWNEIMSEDNNLLIKFVIDLTTAKLELYLANKPPLSCDITKLYSKYKWEILLGKYTITP